MACWIERVRVASVGNEANGGTGGAAVGADGRFVRLASEASNLVPGDTKEAADIVVVDRTLLPEPPPPYAMVERQPVDPGLHGALAGGPATGLSANDFFWYDVAVTAESQTARFQNGLGHFFRSGTFASSSARRRSFSRGSSRRRPTPASPRRPRRRAARGGRDGRAARHPGLVAVRPVPDRQRRGPDPVSRGARRVAPRAPPASPPQGRSSRRPGSSRAPTGPGSRDSPRSGASSSRRASGSASGRSTRAAMARSARAKGPSAPRRTSSEQTSRSSRAPPASGRRRSTQVPLARGHARP